MSLACPGLLWRCLGWLVWPNLAPSKRPESRPSNKRQFLWPAGSIKLPKFVRPQSGLTGVEFGKDLKAGSLANQFGGPD